MDRIDEELFWSIEVCVYRDEFCNAFGGEKMNYPWGFWFGRAGRICGFFILFLTWVMDAPFDMTVIYRSVQNRSDSFV